VSSAGGNQGLTRGFTAGQGTGARGLLGSCYQIDTIRYTVCPLGDCGSRQGLFDVYCQAWMRNMFTTVLKLSVCEVPPIDRYCIDIGGNQEAQKPCVQVMVPFIPRPQNPGLNGRSCTDVSGRLGGLS